MDRPRRSEIWATRARLRSQFYRAGKRHFSRPDRPRFTGDPGAIG